MKKNLFLMFIVSSLCLMMATIGFAQDDQTLSSAAGDLYVISAKAGVVNYVEGKVSVERKTGESGLLVKGEMLEVGDKVSTGSNSRAEVLLNPGSFIRLDRNSSFEFTTTDLDDLRLKVNRGSALFEVYASDDFKVTVNTLKAKFYLVDTGVYRVNVINDGVGYIEVHRGQAQVGSTSADVLKKGRTATVNGNEVAVAKFNRSNLDNFESWSKSRAKSIAQANKRLRRDNLENTLLSGNRVDCFGSMGLWVRNRRLNSYSFLPFGYGWRSPYGFGLGTNTSICDTPYYSSRPIYRTRRIRTTPTDTVPEANVRRARRNRTPPFRRMERSKNVRRQRGTRNRNNFPIPTSTGGSSTRRTTRKSTPTKTTTPTRRTSPRRTSPSIPKPSKKN